MKVKTYPPSDMCAKCGGFCCKKMGCCYSPQDFKDLSYDGLKREIEKGRISIDWWEASPREYYLRARNVNEPIVCGSWGGVCVNLTDKGCSLPWEERPLEGRALEPKLFKFRFCVPHYTKEDCKNEWKPYAAVLRELVAYFNQEGGTYTRNELSSFAK